MTGWEEVADGVFQHRYDPLDVSVCVVRGSDGLLVVDTRSSHREADQILADLRVFAPARVRWVVNTHAHYDHTFGNARFGPGSPPGATIYGHHRVPAHFDAYERPRLADWIARGVEPADDWRQVVITEPDVLVHDHHVLDLGDRRVDLLHLGRGHTDNDLVLHASDADAWLVGDLIEESGPPMYGSGSFPFDWPRTVAALAARLEPGVVVVPGHGAPIGAPFVTAQQHALGRVAEQIRALHAAGVPADAAPAAGDWPFPADGMASAVADGYRQLDDGALAAG